MAIPEGQMAPDFSLADEAGVIHSLQDYRGQSIVLYFYPKDDTPGCTKEACSFRDNYQEYHQAGITVLGISPDTVRSHEKFKTKYNLPFTLLADEGHVVCELFGVWGPKKLMGKSYEGVQRTTFIIGPDGMIRKVFENVKPTDHAREVLQVISQIR